MFYLFMKNQRRDKSWDQSIEMVKKMLDIFSERYSRLSGLDRI